jgi:hypothetical protein
MPDLFGPGVPGQLAITDDDLLIASNPFIETARGQISNLSGVEKFGRNADIDTGGFEDVWDGGATWVAPTQPRVHNVASSSANDASAGTGARTVQLYGLDADGLLANEIVSLSGTANVATAGTYSMVHRMIIRSAGTIAANEGTVTATAQTDATVTAQIEPTQNQTLMAIYQIPSDKSGYITSWYGSMQRSVTTGAANMRLLVKPPNEVFQVKRIFGLVGTGNGSFKHGFDFALPVSASSIIKVDCDVSASNTDAAGGFSVLLEDN